MAEKIIKLLGVEPRGGYRLALRFSGGATGVLDFATFVDAGTPMTEPLRDPAFFARYFIEMGALGWPNGLELGAGALWGRLEGVGELVRGKRVG